MSSSRLRKRPARSVLNCIVYEHDDCKAHNTKGADDVEHQEAPMRLDAIKDKLVRIPGVVFTNAFEPATDEQLLRVHSAAYLETLMGVEHDFQVGRLQKPEPLSPHVVTKLFPSMPAVGMTLVSVGSMQAARRAAGAVIAAIDGVLAPQDGPNSARPHAFCLVRPPGHHACIDGYDPVAGGCGFCFVNNVAVGAAHAIHARGRRVAIVDFDVHHGNGTENIVTEVLSKMPKGQRTDPPPRPSLFPQDDGDASSSSPEPSLPVEAAASAARVEPADAVGPASSSPASPPKESGPAPASPFLSTAADTFARLRSPGYRWVTRQSGARAEYADSSPGSNSSHEGGTRATRASQAPPVLEGLTGGLAETSSSATGPGPGPVASSRPSPAASPRSTRLTAAAAAGMLPPLLAPLPPSAVSSAAGPDGEAGDEPAGRKRPRESRHDSSGEDAGDEEDERDRPAGPVPRPSPLIMVSAPDASAPAKALTVSTVSGADAAAATLGGAEVESSVLFCSTHLYEHFPENPDFDFFPGRGGPAVAQPTRPVPAAPKTAPAAPKTAPAAPKPAPAAPKPAPAALASKDKDRPHGSSSQDGGSSQGSGTFNDSTAGPIGPGGYAAGVWNSCPSILNLPLEPLWVRASRVKDSATKDNDRLRGRGGFRTAVVEKLVPSLEAFGPDLLIISAGFDGAKGDDGNAQDDVGGLDLSDEDFRWVTQKLCNAVGKTCPVVSVLEGGYGTYDASKNTYNRATLASGCAAHVSALCAHARNLQQ